MKNYETNQLGASAVVNRRRATSSHYDDGIYLIINQLIYKIYKIIIFIFFLEDEEDCLTTFTDYSEKSRLNTEFEVIGVVGHGAFGEVLKVKNKLDSRLYAIKRIRTNLNSKKYNKQIIREIKLLSRLNHENVVRLIQSSRN